MLFLIGLGLCDGTDITLRGHAAVKAAKKVYLEAYTSLLQCTHGELEKELGVKVHALSREDVEQHADKILAEAQHGDIAVLVIGDPFGATTHADLYLRAREAGITVQIVHNASILSAVGSVGLELYKYGRTVSIPYWEKGYEPFSFLTGVKENFSHGLHTLCLLDIKADQKRFMTVQEGLDHLVKAEAFFEDDDLIREELPVIGVARLGCPDQKIVAGTIAELRTVDFGKPPHAIIIPGHLHPVEEEMLALW